MDARSISLAYIPSPTSMPVSPRGQVFCSFGPIFCYDVLVELTTRSFYLVLLLWLLLARLSSHQRRHLQRLLFAFGI
ncbi:hypothetical protein DVH24_035719 [Malus domestica]|uniref:Uncharacterized protein n=1 Tax=Malus domestica TaxID=3750 RepID=A0A498JV29_MALDO|nr:hypothetical protein DVH24_035719 [Malus domestica]